jgi:hypothetical protein
LEKLRSEVDLKLTDIASSPQGEETTTTEVTTAVPEVTTLAPTTVLNSEPPTNSEQTTAPSTQPKTNPPTTLAPTSEPSPPTEPPEFPSNFTLILRSSWNAGELSSLIKKLPRPSKRIIIAHSGESSDHCDDTEDCARKVKTIQTRSTELLDIPFNFLIGGDGSVFEGRGFYQGEHSSNSQGSSFNDIGICVAFMGVYKSVKPSDIQMRALKSFVECFVEKGEIDGNFTIFSQQQLVQVKTDASALHEEIKKIEKFYSGELLKMFSVLSEER